MFYPPEGLCASIVPKVVQLFFNYILLVWEEVPGVSKSSNIGGLFENLKMLYPPEGLCRAEPERGPIVFTYVLLCRKGSQFTSGFLTLKMF